MLQFCSLSKNKVSGVGEGGDFIPTEHLLLLEYIQFPNNLITQFLVNVYSFRIIWVGLRIEGGVIPCLAASFVTDKENDTRSPGVEGLF